MARCWRNCGEGRAHQAHIFWTCPVLKHFWVRVGEKMNRVLQCSLPLGPEHIILRMTPSQISLTPNRHMYRILRIVAIKQITKNWLKPDVTQITKWKAAIKEMYNMKRITYRIRNRCDVFEFLCKRFLEMNEV